MGTCYLEGHGSCGGGISREHYISEGLLRQLGDGSSATIGGARWQKEKDTLQRFNLSALRSNILCRDHNSGLSPIDTAAIEFFKAIQAIDKKTVLDKYELKLNGLLIERWFLKVLLGLCASKSIVGIPPEKAFGLLASGNKWPDGWGMYVYINGAPTILGPDLLVEVVMVPDTQKILGAFFFFSGIEFRLLLGKPNEQRLAGIRRPQGLIFRDGPEDRGIQLVWPVRTGRAVVLTRRGTVTGSSPRVTDGWKGPY